MPQYHLRIHGYAAARDMAARDYPDLASAMARGNRVISSMLSSQGGDALLLRARLDIEDEYHETVARILFAEVAQRTGNGPVIAKA